MSSARCNENTNNASITCDNVVAEGVHDIAYSIGKCPALTKSDIAISLSQNYGFKLSQATEVVETFLNEIMTSVACGDRIELRKLGSWVMKARAAKTIKNPRTKVEVHLESGSVVYFRASRELIKSLNKVPNKN